MGTKKKSGCFAFKKVGKEYAWLWKLWAVFSGWRWRRLNLRSSVFDAISFRVLYFLEAVVLVAVLCFFFLCCGCHI